MADALAYLFTTLRPDPIFESVPLPVPLLLLVLGTALGITVGAVPGLTGAMLIALTLPLTFGMPPLDALVLLVSMYVGSISGGLISATLLRMPGTPASMMTTLDGYPLAQAGRPGRALGLGIGASFVGGMISWGFLVGLAHPIAEYSTMLSSFAYFSLVLTALVLIASVSERSLLNGIIAGLLGILCSLPGESPVPGEPRLTFGFHQLNGGLQLLPVLVGLFAVGQAIRDILWIDRVGEPLPVGGGSLFLTIRDWKRQGVNLIRSSLIGTWIGILPGIGANIGSVVAYSTARNSSEDPEEFGKGAEAGIVASEAANNATVGGALIPLVSLGIPGSVIDAILLGALVLHGMTPGPQLFEKDPEVVYVIIATMLVANVVMYGLMVLSVRGLAKLISVPRGYLLPAILVFCVVGSFALSSRWFDVGVMLAFGLIGFGMERVGLPLAPFVIGFVLWPIAEKDLSAGLMKSQRSWWPLVTDPGSLTLLVIALGLLVWSLWRRRA